MTGQGPIRPTPPAMRVRLQGFSPVPNWVRRLLGRQQIGVFYTKPFKRGDQPLPGAGQMPTHIYKSRG